MSNNLKRGNLKDEQRERERLGERDGEKETHKERERVFRMTVSLTGRTYVTRDTSTVRIAESEFLPSYFHPQFRGRKSTFSMSRKWK